VPHSVFVSYSQPDRQCAFELVSRVEACGVSAWIAPRDVQPAADWAAQIIDAISAARVMVLILSLSSNESPQVRREVERAVSKQIQILPFRLDDVVPSKSLEYFISSQHWLDAFPPPLEPHFARLCTLLQGSLSAPHQPLIAAGAAALGSTSTQLRALSAGRLDDTSLSAIETLLARHIGPVAKLLVRRAAVLAQDREQLVAALAAEIDSQSERSEFINACRQSAASRGAF